MTERLQCRTQLISFEAPSTWTDSTVITLHPPVVPDPLTPKIEVSREVCRGSGLEAHAAHALVGVTKARPELQYLDSTDLEVDGRPALRARFSATGPPPLVDLTVVLVDGSPDPDSQITVFRASALREQGDDLRRALDEVLASTRFRFGVRPAPATQGTLVPESSDEPPSSAPSLPAFPMPGPSPPRR